MSIYIETRRKAPKTFSAFCGFSVGSKCYLWVGHLISQCFVYNIIFTASFFLFICLFVSCELLENMNFFFVMVLEDICDAQLSRNLQA